MGMAKVKLKERPVEVVAYPMQAPEDVYEFARVIDADTLREERDFRNNNIGWTLNKRRERTGDPEINLYIELGDYIVDHGNGIYVKINRPALERKYTKLNGQEID